MYLTPASRLKNDEQETELWSNAYNLIQIYDIQKWGA